MMMACSVKSDDGCYRACGNIYFPLCGQDGTEYKFFGNRCLMDAHNDCKARSEFSQTSSESPNLKCFFFSDFIETEEVNCAEFSDPSYINEK